MFPDVQGFVKRLQCVESLVLQALAELYHIQEPLFGSAPHAALDPCRTPSCLQNVGQLAPPQAPDTDQATPDTLAAANLAESFISRQHLGTHDASDAATMDVTSMPEDAVDATVDGMNGADTQTMRPDLLHASSFQVEGSRPGLDLAQPGCLCSQEWKIQHVSSPCITTLMTRMQCTPPQLLTCQSRLLCLAFDFQTRFGTSQHCTAGHIALVLHMCPCCRCQQVWQGSKQLCMCMQVILPAVRMFLKPGKQRATDGSVVELTRLEKLYKIFERC